MIHEPVTLDSSPVLLSAIAKASARAGRRALHQDVGSGRTRAECFLDGAFADGGWSRRTALDLVEECLEPNVATRSEEWDPRICSEALGIFEDEYRLEASECSAGAPA